MSVPSLHWRLNHKENTFSVGFMVEATEEFYDFHALKRFYEV